MKHGTWSIRNNRESRALRARPLGVPHAPCSMFHAPCRGGFALLFAVIATSVLLSIAGAIWNIALRQVILSSFGRESQFAFYAADTGAECALYWDFRQSPSAFSTSTPTDITCIGQRFTVGNGGGNGTSTVQNLRLGADSSGPCVDIFVTKSYYGPNLRTDIKAYGHNTCDATSPTRVERGLFVSYFQ